MQVMEIKSLEQQAEELLQNIALIKEELSKKVAAREQFEQETTKIVRSLTAVSSEVTNLKNIFGNLGESEMVELFAKIDESNSQLSSAIPQFEKKVEDSLSSFDQLYVKLEQSNQHIVTEFSKSNDGISTFMGTMEGYDQAVKDNFEKTSAAVSASNEGVATLTKRMESYNQLVAKYFDNISAIVSKSNEGVTTLTNRMESYDQAAAKNFGGLNAQVATSNEGIKTLTNRLENTNETIAKQVEAMKEEFSSEIHHLEQKMMKQQQETTQKINSIMGQLNESEKRQMKLFEQISSISNWLEMNGEILLANSRAGLFGRKQ